MAANAIQGLLNCVEATAAYARERQIFGHGVLDNQVVHFKLAELKTEIEALRSFCGGNAAASSPITASRFA